MLLEYSCQNYKSILDKIVFSMCASSENKNTYTSDKFNILKSAIIYGANGSGKSNFINSLNYLKSLVLNSLNHLPNINILQHTHKLGMEKDSIYELKFIKNNIYYYYKIVLNSGRVRAESLFYSPNKRITKIFERVEDKIIEGANFKGKFKECKNVLSPNKLLLSCASVHSKVDEAIRAFNFFKDDIVFYDASNSDNWFDYSLYKIYNNIDIKKMMIKVMNELDIPIKDIKIEIEKRKIGAVTKILDIFDEKTRQLLSEQSIDFKRASLDYGNFSIDLISEESSGIRKLFGLLCPVLDIIKNNKILICDEFENYLHESIIKNIIEQFNTSFFKTWNPQLIFTTHDSNLLNYNLFDRDQIWFTEIKNDNRSTDIYSLLELKDIRKSEKFSSGYINGKYGAIPMINLDLIKLIGVSYEK